MAEEKKITQDDKIWGVLSYLWILSIVALAMKKDNDYVRFHANQGALLFVISLVGIIPVLGQLVGLIVFIVAIVCIIKAYSGEKWPIPIFAKQAEEFGGWVVKTLNL
ncbi:MAG: hypothetical protein WCT26_04690 [Candidatus Buchananbacteria bacterium]|jgi:uncharacterized membrane protein